MKRPATLPLWMLPALAAAQAPASVPSPIAQVLVYPGGAQVERTLAVPAGATQARFICLSAQLDPASLQISASAGLALGELNLSTGARERSPECRNEDPRLVALDTQRAALEAEQGGLELALGLLKNSAAGQPQVAGPALASTLEAARRQGQELLNRQYALKKQREVLDRQINALKDELPPSTEGEVAMVQLRLAAPQAGELKLSYRVPSAGWQPRYRAQLDTATGALRIERLAQLSQSSGEDWREVPVRLSTVQPRQAVAPGPLRPWTLAVRPPEIEGRVAYAPAAPVAPAPMMRSRPAKAEAPPPSFDVSVFEGAFATEYALPGRITLRGNGQQLGVSLGTQPLAAKVYARIQPQTEAQAYLVAEVSRPEGIWPAGELQLFRDGNFVGQSRLTLGGAEQLDLFFGRDERLRVRVEPEKANAGDAGLLGGRLERRVQRAYVLENTSRQAVPVQLLESCPVSQHEDIRVSTRFQPAPTLTGWRQQPGTVAWEATLAPGQSQRIEADYAISTPKDALILEMR